jgi:hypothetical protein
MRLTGYQYSQISRCPFSVVYGIAGCAAGPGEQLIYSAPMLAQAIPQLLRR